MNGHMLWIVCTTITVVLTVDTLRRYFKGGKQWSHGMLIFRLLALPALAVAAIVVAVNLTISIMALRLGPFFIQGS